MKTQKFLPLFLLLLGSTLIPQNSKAAAADAGLVISEFLANNVTVVKDDLGNYSDFVEIYNGSPNAIDLGTYYLTDTQANLTQWQFPSTNIFSGQHLLVWASGLNRRVPGAPLHSNFKLSASGEEIWLVRADASIVHGYTFGPQAVDRSYGLASQTLSSTPFLNVGATARYAVLTNNVNAVTNSVVNNRWVSPAFDDSKWSSGPSGFGFDTNPASVFNPFIGTDVKSVMQGGSVKRSSLYMRVPFTVADLNAVPNPTLQIRYDDGFVAYLNGVEIARRGIATNTVPLYTTVSLTARTTNDAVVIPEQISSPYFSPNLVQGQNILAIQGANKSTTDPDFLIAPELVSSQVSYLSGVESERYFTKPSPGTANGAGFDGASGEVLFSAASSTFFNNFELTLAPRDPSALAEIRYTIDGKIPTTNSLRYTLPIQVTNSIVIRARVFEPGLLAGPLHTEGFVKVSQAMASTSSDVPMVIVHSFGNSDLTDQAAGHPAYFYVFEPKQGRSSFTNAPDAIFRAGAKVRGSSTAGNPKWNWAVDPWDEDDRSVDIPLLGMPKGNPWVFHAPFGYDPSLYHNPLASDMSNEVGSYAPRYRFAEIYLNTTGLKSTTNDVKATLNAANYFGFYNIMEHIDVSPNRVDVDKLSPGENSLPEVSGGYLFSIDRQLDSDPQYTFAQATVNLLDPDARHISPEQLAYLNSWFTTFGNAIFAKDYTNGAYQAFIDQPAWIDHHLINVISFNVDALRLSGYFRKERDKPGQPGRLVYGPLWDFDRAFGSTDGRDLDPTVWRSRVPDLGTDFFNFAPWFNRLFRDPNFWQAYIDRYQDLREGLFSTPQIFALMDSLNDEVKESSVRDFSRWGNAKRGNSQAGEQAFFKTWMKRRLEFMDGNFLGKPQANLPAGTVAAGTQIILTAPAGATIYYTLDGTDPRAMHGGVNPAALVYSAPITINGEVRLMARANDPAHKNLTGGDNPPINSTWSGPRQLRYITDASVAPGDLVISELNYHPADPTPTELAALPLAVNDDFQFIEIKNVSSHRVDFYGAHFTQGVGFNFKDSPIYALNAGASLLLVKDTNAFALRYGSKSNIAGTYKNALNPAGERIRLETAAGVQLFDFSYSDSWYPTTDGFGYTLVRRSLTVGDSSREAWGPSSALGGSPGVENPAPAAQPTVVINEVLANSDAKQLDTVELLNRSAVPADVGGWYLTDDRTVPMKYRIPANSILSPGGFLTIDENAFNAGGPDDPNSFALSSRGDAIWLFSADAAGNLLPYAYGFTFGASESNISFGRLVISTGKELFVPQATLSLGKANTGPKIGPAVITEIHYHPVDQFLNGAYWNNGLDEFVEIQNITGSPLPLEDAVTVNGTAATAQWHLRGSVDFNFPAALSLAAGERLLVVSFDPAVETDLLASFRARFGVPAAVKVLGPFQGSLNNQAGDVHISRPGPVDSATGDIAYVTVDLVEYEDVEPWPLGADGTGASLQRRTSATFGNDPANWLAAMPTAGVDRPTGPAITITQQPLTQTVVAGTRVTLTVGAQGTGSLIYQWRKQGVNIPGAHSPTLVLDPVAMTDAGSFNALVLDANGSALSASATLTVLQPASITQQPASLNVKPGVPATFTVVATGQGNLSYQWYFNGHALSGATSASLTLPSPQLADSGDYTVKVTDSIGSSTSDPAHLNVLVKPTFLSQPSFQTAVVGDTVQFEVVMDGLAPFSYRWRKAGANIANATNRTLRLSNVQLSNASTNYSVTVTNLAGTTNSITVTLAVMSDFDGDHMGDAWEVANGYSTNNVADALLDDDGDGFTNLQEFQAGTNPHDKTSFLKIDSITKGEAGTQVGFTARTNRGYTLQFRDAVDRGDWQAAAQVPGRNVDAAAVAVDTLPDTRARLYRIVTPHQYDASDAGPTILSAPASTSVDLSAPATFEVQADGVGDLAYQWVKGQSDIPGATSASFTIPSTALSDAGSYAVKVTDDTGTTLSKNATLVVLQKPVITQQPLSQTVNAGATLTLSVKATGAGPLSYQWLYNDHLIPGATGATFTLPNVGAPDAGSYRVSVSAATLNGIQRRSSATALILVNE